MRLLGLKLRGPGFSKDTNTYPWYASSGSLPKGSTFTRAGNARRWNASGISELISANLPRFEYHPATKAFRGLKYEPNATANLLQQARNFTSSWSNSGGLTITPNQISKFGNADAYLLDATATGTTRRIEQSITVSLNPQYRYAIFKPDTGQAPQLREDNGGLSYAVVFDTSTMTATPATGGGTGNVSNIVFESLGDGFYIGGFSYTPTATSSITRFYPRNNSVVLDFIQATEGTRPLSPIVTGASSLTQVEEVFAIKLQYASNDVIFTFDDGSTQTFASRTGSMFNVPALNRTWIASINVVPHV